MDPTDRREMSPTMTTEYGEAISFANSYFGLVDGLAYGLEDHLAEEISLNWFGKIVKGKRNVAAFMRINMNNSRHIFHEITPATNDKTADIGQKKKRKKQISKEEDKNEALTNEVINFSKLRLEDSERTKIEKNEPEKSTLLVEKDVEAVSENVEKSPELESNHDRSLSPVIDCKLNNQNSSILETKFFKANGIVHIYRSAGPNKSRKWYSSSIVSGLPGQTCRRRCKLQVSYSKSEDESKKSERKIERLKKVCTSPEKSPDCNNSKTTKGRKRLNSQEEIEDIEMISLEESFNVFEGFEPLSDSRHLMKYFKTQAMPKCNFTMPKYVGGRLIFDWPGKEESKEHFSSGIKFDYTIHAIVYESDTTNPNPFEEFEERKSLSDTEKSV